MSRKVVFVELPVFSGVVPLASGYMEAVCRKDPSVSAAFDFEKISLPVKTPFTEILTTLRRADAAVYAFSCYVWNSGLVRRLLAALIAIRAQSDFILGGPQVMHQGARYLSPEHENVFICNGEGERTFANFLRTIASGGRDFSHVRGLTYYRDSELVTTEPEQRISDFAEIPSPFLEGLFDGDRYTWVLIETNRGCPFKCNYCYWGAATGSKVHRYDEQRLERELAWISQSGCWYLFIADANWGMLPRDVDLSHMIVEYQKVYGSPISIYFCGSKNTPHRVAEITKIFHDAGLLSCQSVALQTMNPETLVRVNRENIRTSAYTLLQQSLNQQGISSFVEIIWPLPGETLASFEAGLGQLCEIGADSFIVYPLLLMNNVELASKKQEYGLITAPDPDLNSEAEIVVQTNEVDRAAYGEGMWFVYSLTSLYTLRSLGCLGKYLSGSGALTYVELFRGFLDFARRRRGHAWTRFCEDSIASLDTVAFSNAGGLVHLVLHAERAAFDDLLTSFVTAQDFWRDPLAQFFFELDLVNRPFIYRNTPIPAPTHRFRHLRSLRVVPDGYAFEIPEELMPHLAGYIKTPADRRSTRFEVNHRRSQMTFVAHKPPHELFMYCNDASQRMGGLMPLWQEASEISA